nr:hypothetical protein [Stappia sediminis]
MVSYAARRLAGQIEHPGRTPERSAIVRALYQDERFGHAIQIEIGESDVEFSVGVGLKAGRIILSADEVCHLCAQSRLAGHRLGLRRAIGGLLITLTRASYILLGICFRARYGAIESYSLTDAFLQMADPVSGQVREGSASLICGAKVLAIDGRYSAQSGIIFTGAIAAGKQVRIVEDEERNFLDSSIFGLSALPGLREPNGGAVSLRMHPAT